MKKNEIILYMLVTVIAAILTGALISSFLWDDDSEALLSGFFTGEERQNQGGETDSGVSAKNRRNAVQAKYKITNSQSYYQPLTAKEDRNILLIGEDAYSGNFDTIMIASISEKNKKIRLLNFPRDIYVDYSEEVLELLKEKSPKLYEAKGFQKLNAVHTVGSRIEYEEGKGEFGDSDIDFLADYMEEVFQIPVDDFAYVNTKGFREIVDLFEGVDIEVPLQMKYDDPIQDLHIDLRPGIQHLNGEQAEGFVRFRQGFDKNGVFKNYSDQFRKENQNAFMKAFFNQHVTLKNLGKVDELTRLMNKNIRTSITGVKTIASYANLMRKALNGEFEQESRVIECSDTEKINGVYFDVLKTK